MKTTKTMRSVLAMLLVAVMMLAAAGCTPAESTEGVGVYTYNTYNTITPSNWNELTYQDSADTEIMSYIGSAFFGFDFAYDANGEIVPGGYEVVYEAATKLEDVTAKYAEAWGLPADGKGYAYAITLRNDLKWENGDPIKAEDFVYTMQQQLDPLFQNYRADSFYVGSTIIINAQEYVKQGQTLETLDNGVGGVWTMDSLVKGADGVYTQADGSPIYFALNEKLDWCGGKTVTQYAAYLDATAFAALQALADAETGRVKITDETIALWTTLITTEDWGENASYLANYLVGPYTYPELSFDKVGMFVGENEYEIVVCLANPIDLLKEDGTLSYKAAYNFASLPLVHKATYEACKIAPTEGNTLWTTNYNTSAEKTMSWGPYKLESFQADKQYVLVKNDNWYGFALPENEGLYQTTRIVADTVEDWQAAWTLFQAGKLDGIGIDVSIADDYKGSERAYFTPDDYVGSMQLQSNKEQLKARETDGVNKTLLSYVDFRKALSLSIDRADFAVKCTTSSKQGFGLYNTMHYHDVANQGVYRDTDEAKQVLCDIYGVDASKYENLDKAVEAITGYNLELARQLMTSAYNEALAAGDIKATDKVVLTFGTASVTEAFTRQVNYIKEAWQAAAVGTPLEGKIDVEPKEIGTNWANDFRAGSYDVCLGGWSGAAWDPGYFLLAYLSPSYMYSKAWDTSNTMMTFTMKGVGENGADITDTMSLMAWYNCLNGASSAKYDFSSNALEESQRLQLIAALEKEVLKVYYTVPLYNYFGASMLSYQIDYVTYEYNTFMGYGGVKYMTYNFDDAGWNAEVAKNNNQLNYK